MPWGFTATGDMWCTGACGGTGTIPCPIDHDAQPPNDEDEDGPYFFCEYGNGGLCDNTGHIPCPECENQSREDTYVE